MRYCSFWSIALRLRTWNFLNFDNLLSVCFLFKGICLKKHQNIVNLKWSKTNIQKGNVIMFLNNLFENNIDYNFDL